MIGSNLNVAKKFFETGSGPVTADHNASFLKQELVWLKQGQWFWDRFKDFAKEKSVDISLG